MSALRLQALQLRLLEPIDLTVEAGELVFLCGPSGAGKSLLLRAIADLDPSTGEAWCDDTARSALPAHAWRRRVGLLPADSGWWADRVGVHFPPAESAEHDPAALLARLGFGPEVLDWEVRRLSTGERQRLALARLLANRPEVLLLDEATANLDPENRARVEAVIGDYRAERAAAVLWVSHDPEQRERMNGRRLVIRDGRIEPELQATDAAETGR
ncbi:ATP-binding cassette domain-containing protein [uncultured Thiohalocapsa sp.]|uniref:ABC transporter ATP-binding protein n=1 Tax=uncultured Thiohalocapsa sp. TaxID=768990 RepID=UPI0025FBDDD7|nr:ATP-binding cassette domain-containing protein [uncultured Thiohalocapsa sp.]